MWGWIPSPIALSAAGTIGEIIEERKRARQMWRLA
jgi:hypothetical protein